MITPADLDRRKYSRPLAKVQPTVHIFGSRGIVSEVVNGKRAISKTQAKKLGDFFHVAPDLFI